MPQDVLYTIVSKLPPKEFARTSVLSSKWRGMWSVCPRLTFDGAAVCKCNTNDLHQHTIKFIHETNAILQKHRGKVVETIVTKFPGRTGRGTGSRVEGRDFVKLWYEGGIPLWNENPKFGT